jgi:hypothetical protein
MHVLHFLRWLALFASPPSPPLSEGEQPYSPLSPTPSSPTPPLPRRDQQERPIARVLPRQLQLPPISPIPPPWDSLIRDHENIVWAGAANHPPRRSCYHAGRVGHYSCSLGRPCLLPHGPSSAQYPAIDPPIPHRARTVFRAFTASTTFLLRKERKIPDGQPARLILLQMRSNQDQQPIWSGTPR